MKKNKNANKLNRRELQATKGGHLHDGDNRTRGYWGDMDTAESFAGSGKEGGPCGAPRNR